ncbi:uncharacterized protein B0I36DRAFT_332198 [Microdochium trichocladiopsis]|uniref:Uncharacterized protein n=1 Tax=Microdochium trichocladiopsis TaxID=1682393 RepID=A0A9P8XZG6_9PEZI|nr:uncharacterized protein B0I36DRAFT_332198 [Microdochium trichocladiopsis]KAH7024900.1 hypothetical protein B0I36DRAFT_332198 [Microdochium trichocladiopsis]
MNEFQIKARPPPFLKDNAVRRWAEDDVEWPATFQCGDDLEDPASNVLTFLALDLQTVKLDSLHKHLWLAGLMRPARPLHRQRLLGRTILITERPDEHLVWHEKSIFIKPLPECLLSYEFWTTSICPHEALYRSASGILRSYTWLIRSKSDLTIAHETGLLPADVDWTSWTLIARDVIRHQNHEKTWRMDGADQHRYSYGELRLSRLNTLCRVQAAARLSARDFVGGYMTGSQRYTTLFERNFGWLLAVFVYITVVLSAMQVALATGRFEEDERFQQFSYGVAVASIALVAAATALALLVWAGLFWFHLLSSVYYNRRVVSRGQP